MATLLNAATSDGAGTGVSLSGPSTVMVHADSVFDGAQITLEIADTDTATDYKMIETKEFERFEEQTPKQITLNVLGAYYLRAKVSRAGASTSLNVVVIQ